VPAWQGDGKPVVLPYDTEKTLTDNWFPNNEDKIMLVLLIADKDRDTRNQMASLLGEAGYDVMVTDQAAEAIHTVLKKNTQVLILGTDLDRFNSAELVPLLKKCNRNLMIILVADDAPLPLIRKIRKEGIFYHALRPIEPEGREEILQVVKCAFDRLSKAPETKTSTVHANQ
jgi:DNA-binding NtrC family response regulator